jgi:hypothetical protein
VKSTGLPGNERSGWNLVFIAWVMVTGATLGSLFFSEVMGVPVCALCWYQPLSASHAVNLRQQEIDTDIGKDKGKKAHDCEDCGAPAFPVQALRA